MAAEQADRPKVLIAYDGSDLARAALRQAALLFPGGPALVVTVWEPGLAGVTAVSPGYDLGGLPAPPPDPQLISEVDRAQEDHATVVSEEGARLAASLGLEAEAHALPDELRVADAIVDAAGRRGAAVVVIGSHRTSGLRPHLLGSTSRRVLAHCPVPVLVVREETARDV